MAWSTFVTGALWVTCLSLFLQAVGYAIPFWLSFEAGTGDTDFGVYIGVWYTMTCIKGESDSCKSKTIKPEFENEGLLDNLKIDGNSQEFINTVASEVLSYNVYWWAIQLSTTIGIFLALLATLILICCRCAGIHSKCMFIIAAVSLLLGGLVSLGIAIVAAIAIGTEFEFVDYKINGETFPWSVLVFGVGGILALIASSMLLIITFKWREYGAYEPEDKESFDDMPMSNVNDGYGRDPYDHRKEYNNYDRARYGHDRPEPRGYGDVRKYDGYRESRGHRDGYRDGNRDNPRDGYRDDFREIRDNYRDRGYDYDRGQNSTEYLYRPYNHRRY